MRRQVEDTMTGRYVKGLPWLDVHPDRPAHVDPVPPYGEPAAPHCGALFRASQATTCGRDQGHPGPHRAVWGTYVTTWTE